MVRPLQIPRLIGRVFSTLLCAAVLFTAAGPSLAARDETPRQTIRVGSFPYEGHMSKDKDGRYSGYGFDYLQELARYTGWQYEFVDAEWSECVEMLERGEIDLMGAVMQSPERDAVLDFSTLPMLSGYGILVTTQSNEDLPYEDFERFDGLRVGTVAGSMQTDSYLAYSREHNFTSQMVAFSTQDEMEAAQAAGEVDAIILSNAIRAQSLRVVATFGARDGYFATTKGNTAVLTQLNEAMRQIRLRNPYFNDILDQKYFNLQASSQISLTREELDFVASAPSIPCVYIPDSPPFTAYNEQTGEMYGVAADLCRLLEERTGLTFTWSHARTTAEAVDMLRSGEALMIPAKYHDMSWAWSTGASLTEPYLRGQMVMVTSARHDEPGTVAIYDQDSQGRLAAEVLSDGAGIRQYGTILRCVDAVLEGEVDATFANSNIAAYLGNNPKYARLQTTPLYGYSADVAMAVSGKANPLLLSVLDKGLRSVSATEVNQFALTHMRLGQDAKLATLLYLHPAETVAFVAFSLLLSIVALIIIFRIRLKSSKAMRRALYTDKLTGLPNYRAMSEAAPTLLRHRQERYAIVYLDIHRFKAINDTLGYQTGDQVLITTSNLLHAFVQPDERFARLYADTFVLLLRDSDRQVLEDRLDKLFHQQLAHIPVGETAAVSPLFLGGVYPLPQDMENLDQACDRANYTKDSILNPCANTFVFYDTVIRDRVLEEKELEQSMPSATKRCEFVPFYQPKVDAVSGKVVGAEALVRWNHPEKGLLPPGVFLPFYERNGFITQIDLMIFEQVCRDMQQWLARGGAAVPVSVNFSRHHMSNSDLPKKLLEITQRYEVPPSLLEVEITETQELDNLETAVELVNGLKACGFGVSIDDYGTGYSSIAFLQQLPLDCLKLDRAFTLNAMESNKAQDIMRYLVKAMQRNNINVVCEGVETSEQRDFVMSQNCRFIQGYFYSAPLPLAQYEAYLLEHGTTAIEMLDYFSVTHLDQTRWTGTEDFLSRAMPSWFACCLVAPQFPVEYISPTFLEGMGYSALEFMSATDGYYVNWVHPDDVTQALERLAKPREAEHELVLQYRLRKKDGSYRWVRELNRMVLLANGQKATLCACTDITDLVILQSEQKRLLDTIPGGVGELLLTPDGPVVQQATEQFYNVLGYTSAELAALGNNLGHILYESDLPDASAQLEKLLRADETSCSCNFRVRTPGGRLHWLAFQGTVFSSPQGPRVTVVVLNNDEAVLSRQAAEVGRAKLELILTSTDHAVFEYDVATSSIISHHGLALYGIPDDLAIDVPRDFIATGFMHPDDIGEYNNVRHRIAEGETCVSYEIRIRNRYDLPDAPYIWIRISLSALFNQDNCPTQAVGIVENIDQEKHFEYALRQETQFRKAFTESSLMAFEFNLTQDSLQRISGVRGIRLQELCDTLPKPNRYSDVMVAALNVLIVPEDTEYFAREMSREHLLDLHSRGRSELEVEYRRYTAEGLSMWTSALVHLTLDHLNGDVIGYAYHRDIHERKIAEQGLMEQASQDALTGLLNRSAGEQLMQAYLLDPVSPNQVQAFLMLDVDRFKTLNDTCGHPIGDQCLLGLAEILRGQLRTYDVIARMGGDEFAVLLKNLPSAEHSVVIARKLAAAVREIGTRLNLDMDTGISIGIALAPQHGADFETLYRCADEALYQAKRRADERIVLYDPDCCSGRSL